jgi:hypothetical protein
MTPFGPQLIGETEKLLTALLHRALEGTGLTERHWVCLRLAQQANGDLATTVQERAQFPEAVRLVADLTERGLLADDRLTAAGRELVATVQERITATTAPLWADLPAEETRAAARALATVRDRARALLS